MENRIGLQKLEGTKTVEPGDIFVLQLVEEPHRFRFGRVVATDVGVAPSYGFILFYIFKEIRDTKDDIPDLRLKNRLFQPMLTTKIMWEKGFFEIVARPGRNPEGQLKMHYFEDHRGRYYDEKGREVLGPVPIQKLSMYRRMVMYVGWLLFGYVGMGIPRLSGPICDPSLIRKSEIERLLTLEFNQRRSRKGAK